MIKEIVFSVNDETYKIETHASRRLLDVLRDDLGLMGTKDGCGQGECGACTVLLNGRAVYSCLVMIGEVEGSEIWTIEGLNNKKLHPIQKAFVDTGAIQCGFCTPGMIMSTKALLNDNPNPSEEEIKNGLAGNICRCTGYTKIIEAVKEASRLLNKGGANNEL